MARAIVTGGAGFIGRHVTKALLEQGYEVTVLDNLISGNREHIPPQASFIEADIRKYEEVEKQIQKGDVVFHLAALTSVSGSIEHPLSYHETNIRGTYNVFEAARKKEAKGVVFSSSASVYGNQEGVLRENSALKPMSPYAFQKMFGEQLGSYYAASFSFPSVALRYFNVYGIGNHEEGSYAPVTARFLKAKREGRPLPIVGDGKQTRDFIHVTDIAKANVRAALLLEKGTYEVINVCSGIPTSVNEIAEIVGGIVEHLPPRIEPKHSCGDPSLEKTLLGLDTVCDFKNELGKMINGK